MSLLLTAIVIYLTRGQMKAEVMNSLESIATRSAKLQAEISNRQFADWLAKNEQKLLAQPELRVKDPAPLAKADQASIDETQKFKENATKKICKKNRYHLSFRK